MQTVKNLKRFEDFSPAQRASMRYEVHEQLAAERVWGQAAEPFTDPEDLIRRSAEIVRISPDLGGNHFGIVSPHRDRYPGSADAISEQSYPYLLRPAHVLLQRICTRAHADIMDLIEAENFGFHNFAFSVTSLLRTTPYQEYLIAEGKLASEPHGAFRSSHCYGVAFDIDHSGGYVLVGEEWRPTNPDRNPEYWAVVRPVARLVLGQVLQELKSEGVINVIDEIPDGRGVFHVALLPASSDDDITKGMERV